MKEKPIESGSLTPNGYEGGTKGSMNNQMYRNIHVNGYYSSFSGRDKNRFTKKMRGVCITQNKKFWEL